jgi:hypothetical protein
MVPRITARHLGALGALALAAACSDATPTAPAGPDAGAPLAARAAQAQARLEVIFQRVSPDVMAIPGTVFSDNDERVGKVVIGVADMGAAGQVRAAMARLGVAADDYAVELTQPIEFKATLRDRFRPTVAGIQIHFGQYVCSIGFNAAKDGQASFITASHCTDQQGGTEGTTYAQPSRTVDPTVIATEVDDPEYVRGGAGCPHGKRCRWSDASRAAYSAGIGSNYEIAKTTGVNNGSITTAGVFTVSGKDATTTNFAVGTQIDKVGRTTGWTRGEVTRTCTNTSVQGSTVYLFCQTFVSDPGGATVVGGGDSGSGTFRVTSGNAQIVGILWGGSTDNKLFVFSPLASVERELGALTVR